MASHGTVSWDRYTLAAEVLIGERIGRVLYEQGCEPPYIQNAIHGLSEHMRRSPVVNGHLLSDHMCKIIGVKVQ